LLLPQTSQAQANTMKITPKTEHGLIAAALVDDETTQDFISLGIDHARDYVTE
jgi:hypothetical protein